MINVTFDADIIKTPQFEEQLKAIIAEFNAHKSTAAKTAADRGTKLKQTPMLSMMHEGKFTFDFIMSEFPKIAEKESKLPSSQREVIKSLVFNAAQRTVILEKAERARKIEEKANERVEQEEKAQ